MALQQAVGAALAVSASLPATHDSTGFEALTPTSVGYINSIPSLDGTRDVATFDDLTTGEEMKFADVMRAGEGTFSVGLDPDDSGQGILESAKDSGDKVAILVTLKDGTKYYRTAVVTSFMPTGIETGNVVTAEVGLAFEKSTVKVAAP